MVCCLNTTVSDNREVEESVINPVKKKPENMDESSNDGDLKLKKLAGGSIVDYPPLFSPDEESLFIISGNTVQIFSTSTGEFLRSLEGPKDNIVAIQYELKNNKYLLACSKSGEIVKWKWKSANVENKIQISMPEGAADIRTFHCLEISVHSDSALITFADSYCLRYMIINISTGSRINCPVKLNLTDKPALVTVETNYFHYFAIAQDFSLYIVNYKNWTVNRGVSIRRVPFTCLQAHPTEEMIATGDETGKILLWRQFWLTNSDLITCLYHWHHTSVESIAFTAIGNNFFSSGHEAVLVKWNLERPDLKDFLPRMSAIILHIRVSDQNSKVAICTADNGIHILGAQNKQLCVVQNFTCVQDNKTGLDKFPVGLQLNPRTNLLVLNGRIGFLQFFSTYTKSLLYNMDIVQQNRLSMETKQILYDIHITHAAFNVDWMVTGEVWDDKERIPESRLKFWEYQKKIQSYHLNTNIELPHEGGFRAIEFSNQYASENLLCATVGQDNNIKIWTVEESPTLQYEKGKIWFCIGQTNYKNMPIESIHFSQDGSLLAAGFGNSLCIYKPENLKIKSILTAPYGLDGSLQKVQITMPANNMNSNSKTTPQVHKNKVKEKRQKILQLFKGLIENNESELIQKININKTNSLKSVKKSSSLLPKLDHNQEEALFRKIQSTTELNLFQKLNLYQKLEIFCSIPIESQERFFQYINATIFETKRTQSSLFKTVRDICKRNRFKAKYKLHKYVSRKWHFTSEINEQLIPLMELLNLNQPNKINQEKNTNYKNCNGESESRIDGNCNETSKCDEVDILPPLQNVSSISSVLFATGEFAHLVVICTEHKVLVWNLLTLRLQCVLKLSVRKIVVDPVTSLFAAFTRNNELYVFLPNAPMVIYRRTNLPTIHGACWVPRRYPKSQSINIDWQSMSTLFFLTDKQELMFLASENDGDIATSAPSFLNEPQETPQYSTFGVYSIKQINAKAKYSPGPAVSMGVPGKAATRRLIDMSTHAMAPVNLLCNDFIKSLLNIDKDKTSSRKKEKEVITVEEYDSDEDNEINRKWNERKHLEMQNKSKSKKVHISSYIQEDKELQTILKEKLTLNFK